MTKSQKPGNEKTFKELVDEHALKQIELEEAVYAKAGEEAIAKACGHSKQLFWKVDKPEEKPRLEFHKDYFMYSERVTVSGTASEVIGKFYLGCSELEAEGLGADLVGIKQGSCEIEVMGENAREVLEVTEWLREE